MQNAKCSMRTEALVTFGLRLSLSLALSIEHSALCIQPCALIGLWEGHTDRADLRRAHCPSPRTPLHATPRIPSGIRTLRSARRTWPARAIPGTAANPDG